MFWLKKEDKVRIWKKEILSGERFRFWRDEILKNKKLLVFSLLLLLLSGILDFISGTYTTKTAGVQVPDLILDHIPSWDISWVFSYGYLLIVLVLFLYPLLFRVKTLHVVVSQFSLLIAVRSFFIVLTHLGSPVDMIPISFPSIFSALSFQNDLFFSGHAAVPFLGFLLFKKEGIKYFFLVASIIMGMTVLILHQHYSIDVFSSFFITYGTYKIGERIFERFSR